LAFRPTIMGIQGMVATEHYLSALTGMQILQQGGNAVDAAVAAIFAEGVLNPHMHTLGGEVPMLIYRADSQQVWAINGNTAAPQRATLEWFAGQHLSLIPGEGLLAAGVPAALDALITALARFGTMTLAEVLQPALTLASQGFPMHPGLRGPSDYLAWSIWHNVQKFLADWPTSAELYLPGGRLPEVGEIFRNGDLARTFERLLHAERAAASQERAAGLNAARHLFYRGEIARQIVTFVQRHGGLLELEDLAAFETKVERPVSLTYRGYGVNKCGPWSQGPVFLQQLRLLEGYDLRTLGHNTAAYIHLITEVAKLAFADREAYYGDPDFVHVPMQELLSQEYATTRRTLIDHDRASFELRPGDPLHRQALRSGQNPLVGREWQRGTVHVAVVDRARNLVAATPSGAWISGSPVVEGLGFPLGTRIQVFYLDRNHPNALAPRKRPRTTLTPSLVLRDGKPYMAFGTMGLDQQDQWSLQCFLNVVEFGMPLQEAIEAPKFSSQHFPSSIYPHAANPGLLRVEGRIPYEVRRALQAKGHLIATQPDWIEGYLVGVQVDADRGVVYGGADPRGELTTLLPAYAIGW
ncbi:MAG: gamma-glutamyltransferase family protein, partial [Nitrospinae bacterium]|nr:gamma-glutamyltransferase family protein [Nitrospinota bacterium]